MLGPELGPELTVDAVVSQVIARNPTAAAGYDLEDTKRHLVESAKTAYADY